MYITLRDCSRKMSAEIENKTVDDLCDFLSQEQEIDTSVVENIRKHKIDGSIFIQLDEEYLREVAPLLGDRIRLKRIVASAVEPFSENTTPINASLLSPAIRTPTITPSVSVSSDIEVASSSNEVTRLLYNY